MPIPTKPAFLYSCTPGMAASVASEAITSAPSSWNTGAPLNLSGLGWVMTRAVIGLSVCSRSEAIAASASSGVNWASKATPLAAHHRSRILAGVRTAHRKGGEGEGQSYGEDPGISHGSLLVSDDAT